MKLEWNVKNQKSCQIARPGFLKVMNYPKLLANIVLVPKKDEKVRICVDNMT